MHIVISVETRIRGKRNFVEKSFHLFRSGRDETYRRIAIFATETTQVSNIEGPSTIHSGRFMSVTLPFRKGLYAKLTSA